MNNCNLNDLCWGGKWVEIREFLDSDSTNKDKKRELVRYRGEDDWTCLHAACCFDAPVDIIESLIDIGGGKELLMMTTPTKRTALHWACDHGASFDIMKMLIDLGGKELIMAKDDDVLCCTIFNLAFFSSLFYSYFHYTILINSNCLNYLAIKTSRSSCNLSIISFFTSILPVSFAIKDC